jgi:hypothetical protein
MYLLWSGKMQGWLSTAGNYVSDMEQALRTDRETALGYCRKHKSQAGYQLLPVALADLEAV